jgi:hypothetical protein
MTGAASAADITPIKASLYILFIVSLPPLQTESERILIFDGLLRLVFNVWPSDAATMLTGPARQTAVPAEQ